MKSGDQTVSNIKLPLSVHQTSNGYYFEVMAMRAILFQREGRDKPAEAYCRIFEAAISKAELEKCNTTTHMDLNKAHTNGLSRKEYTQTTPR